MHILTDLSGNVKFRWLNYPNRRALDKSYEMYNFDRCLVSGRRCKNENDHFFGNMCPGNFHGHYVQQLTRV